MQAKSVRVTNFRNIRDSGEVELLDNLTCLVGKNQSGKTAFLKALHKFNPHDPNEVYERRRDWPRGRRIEYDEEQIACVVQFGFEQDEIDHLSEITSEKMDATEVVVSKDFGGKFEVSFPEREDLFPDKLHPNDVDDACEELPDPNNPVADEFLKRAKECKDEAKRLAREGRFGELASLEASHTERLRAAKAQGNPSPQHENEERFLAEHIQKLKEITSKLESLPTIHKEAHDYIVGRIPTFIYMAQYDEFEGRMILTQLRDRRTAKQLTREDKTFQMILNLAGLDLDTLIQQGETKDPGVIEDRQNDLQDAAKTLTNHVAGRWGQNPYSVEFRVDEQVFLTNIEERDKDIGMLPLDVQAQGFRWFFSFDLRFMHDSQGEFRGCVLLLDEPGLHLHPGGQDDLLKRLDAYSKENTLIYTTHLPFLLDLREPSRLRVLNETPEGAQVTDNLSASGPDERLTLQAALGMRLNQHFLVSQRNLVVEGADDFYVLSELSSLFERAGESYIPDDVEIAAAGGASEAVYMATFMVGQNLSVVALFDSDEEGRKQEEKLRTKWITRYKDAKSDTLLLGAAVGKKPDIDFAIEDLFPEDYYLLKVEEAHKAKMKAAGVKSIKLVGDGLLCNRVEQGCDQAGIQFNKGSVAKLIRKDLGRMTDLSKLDDQTIEYVKSLFASIKKAMPK